MSDERLEEETKTRKIVKKTTIHSTPPVVERKEARYIKEENIVPPPLYNENVPTLSMPNIVDRVNMPHIDKKLPLVPLIQFNPIDIMLIKPLNSKVENIKVAILRPPVVTLDFQPPVNIIFKAPSDVIKLMKVHKPHYTIPIFTFAKAPNITITKIYDKCDVATKPKPIEEITQVQEASYQREELDVAEVLKKRGVENLFELLFEWQNEEEKERFFNAMLSPRLMFVFLVPVPSQKHFPGELLVRKILATEYKRAYNDIEARHDSLGELLEKSKHVITFTPTQVEKYVEYAMKTQRTAQNERSEE